MKLQVLLSAMFLEDYHYIDQLKITSDVVVINQCDIEAIETIEENGKKVEFISTKDRGLSRSRNMAISHASAEVCILCDNDVEYVEGYEELIIQAFSDNPDADIIIFYIKRPERQKSVFSKPTKMNYLTVMKIFSPEIAFRKEKIKHLHFHESFGAGAKYSMGEENIFLYDALRCGLNVLYVPIQIATLLDTESTWFQGYTDKFFLDRGANYYAMTKKFYWFLILQFAFRKRKIYKKDNHFLHAIQLMFQGKREFAAYENISNRRL
ncbi:MAG: glycosyltransferase [Lachnospiraceae bacterium]|nr:glycosyltransferase [Lachnospiraceae bacterium]